MAILPKCPRCKKTGRFAYTTESKICAACVLKAKNVNGKINEQEKPEE